MKRTRIGCVLMAAGNSTRFGGNKLLTDFFGKTLIERAMEAIPRDKLCRAAVVSQYDEALSMALDFDFLTVRNDRPEDGVSRTIRLGLDALGNVDAAMFMVADQPCLSRWSTESLVSFYLKEPDKIAAMAYGARRGNPVIFPKDMFIELRDLTGDTGGSAVICKNQDKLRLYQVEDELELFDADRAAELERLRREREKDMSERIEAIKGNIIYAETPGELTVMPDSWIVTEGGIIRGIFSELPERYAAAEATDYGDMIITPAFTDLHLHAPQYPMLGLGMDLELLGWLNKYAFPTEAMFSDAGYARRVYSKLAHALIERGTTRVCIFSSLHREATNILMDELEKAGVTGYAGKVNMDRNGSEELIETTEESVAETRLFIEENKDRKLIKPILTPRFTPSCTNELMEELGKIAAEYPDIPVQSHLSENTDEMKWVKELHPDCAQYWETYDKYGLWKNRTVMAHCVYSDERERAAMKKAGVWAVHCPDSNTCIASGIAPVRTMLKEGVKVAMGSDIAGGAKLSMLDVATEAIRVSKLRWLFGGKRDEERFLTVAEAFYLITGAGQEYFGARPGFCIGDRLHAVVFDDRGMADNPRMNLSERLERIIYLGERQDIKAVYSEGIRRI